jgi:energy-coupling factor transport system permease protein
MSFIHAGKTNKSFLLVDLDPRTKLLMVLLLSFLSVTIINPLFLFLLLEFILFIIFLANIDFRKIWRYIRPTLWFVGPIFIIQVIFSVNKTAPLLTLPSTWPLVGDFVLISIGSLMYAISISLRIILLAIGSCMFSLTTNSKDFLQSLSKMKIPYSLVFTVGLVIYFLPMVVNEVSDVRDSLETRGLSIRKGSFLSRVKTFRVIVSTVLLNFIEKSKYQALAMESRGFHPRKARTTLHDITFGFVDYVISILSLGITATLLYLFWNEITLFANISFLFN